MIGILFGVVLGALVGWLLARQQARAAVMSGPFSDNYGPALSAIAEARAVIGTGDVNILKHLDTARVEIERAQKWTERFLGQPASAANGSQPVRFETNSTSSGPFFHR